MPNEIWKEFEENQLSHSAAHYLMTIRELLADKGYARVTDIARELNITRGSCSISLKSLKRRGLVVEDENKFLHLSEEGVGLADMVQHNDELLEVLFRDVLGVDAEQAEIDACKLEHLLSIETSKALHRFVSLFQSEKTSVKEFIRDLHRSREKVCVDDAGSCKTCNTVCLYAHGTEQK